MNPGGTKRSSGQPATIRARLKYPDEKAFIKQYVRYVTRTELFIRTAKPKAEGTTVRFDLQIATGDSVLRGVGEVAWNRLEATAEGPAGMGIKFQKLDAKSKETIKRILALKKARSDAKVADKNEAPEKNAAHARRRDPEELAAKPAPRDEKRAASRRPRRSETKLDDIDSMLAEISADRADRRKRRTARTVDKDEAPAKTKERPARERPRQAAVEDTATEERPRRTARRRTDSDLDALLGQPSRRARTPKPDEKELEIPREEPTAFQSEPEFVPDDAKTRPDVHVDSIIPQREAIPPEEPELQTAPGVEVEEEQHDEDEFDIDGLIENTFVEAEAPPKPLHMDSGYIAIKSLAPDMPGMAEMPAEEAIFNPADEVNTETPVRNTEDVVISEDAASLSAAFLDTVDHFGGDVQNEDEFDEPLGIIIDDDEDDEEIDIETSQVDLVPARFGDKTTQLELGDDTSDSLLDALASANADNRIGKDRLNSLIDEMTKESTAPADPAAPDLLGTNDVSSALDEIFVSVDGEEDTDQPMGIDNAPMTLPDEAVPSDLVRPRPETTGLELEELTEDEAEKGRRISFFKKLFGG